MKIKLTGFCFLLLAVACKSKDSIPGGVIPQKKMQAVLWDMMRADQFLADYVLNKDSTLDKETESTRYYQQIFSIHKISKEEFEKSFAWYNARPLLFRSLMDSIAAPPRATVVTAPEQVTTPLANPDTSVEQAPVTPAIPVQPDTLLLRRKRPAVTD